MLELHARKTCAPFSKVPRFSRKDTIIYQNQYLLDPQALANAGRLKIFAIR